MEHRPQRVDVVAGRLSSVELKKQIKTGNGTATWLFIAAGVTYAAYQFASGNYRQVLFAPADAGGVWPMARHYFFFGPRPAQHGTYNPLQKLAYTIALGVGLTLLITGLALYKPVQLSWIVAPLGGLRATRVWHFAAMSALAAFIPGHLIMVALHGWPNFVSMWTGARTDQPRSAQSTQNHSAR